MKKTNVGINKDLYIYVNSIVKPIFDKIPQEKPKNQLLVGRGRSEAQGLALYSPHNYRLYIDFSREKFTPKSFKYPTPKGLVPVTHKSLNHNSEDQFENFKGCRIRVKKKIVEIQNCIDPKRSYLIDSQETAEEEILNILKKKDKECIEALKEFIKILGGSSDFKILKRHSENKIYGTDTINSIPIKEKFHNKIVKKVYNERNVEYSDPVFVVNHLVNTGVIEVVPSICQSLELLAYNINPLRTLKSLIKTIDDVPRYTELIIKLNKKQREELSEWLFKLKC